MDPENEEITLKLEEIEDSYLSLKEFTLNTLQQFGKRLSAIEKKQSSYEKEVRDDLDRLSQNYEDLESRQSSEVSVLREDLDKLHSSFGDVGQMSSGDPRASSPLGTSTPIRDVPKTATTLFASKITIPQSTQRNPFVSLHKTPPAELEEIRDPALRESLKTYIPKSLDPREKLNKIQVAFVNKWIDDANDVKGRKEDGRRLFHAGIHGGIWSSGKVAEGITEPVSWFTEKIRTIKRKERRNSEKKTLQEEFDLAQSVLGDQL